MEPTDELLMRSLFDGNLTDDDLLRLDELLNRSEEARKQVSQWQGWKELDISLIGAQSPNSQESGLLQDAIRAMQVEVSELRNQSNTKIRNVTDPTEKPVPKFADTVPDWIDKVSGITLGKVIGRGAMGVVYEGFDDALGRRVAIKIPSQRCADNPESRERFSREAQAAAQLCHENIVAIHSIQHVEGVPILIQQFIDGETLTAFVERNGRLSAQEMIELATQIARGLVTAHAVGIIHRDLKPENLLIERYSQIVRIADFGLAKRDSLSLITHPNVIAGTPSYMSPEQTLGRQLDARSDLFSFGAVLRYAATGMTPFSGDDTDVVLHRIRTQNLEPLSQIRSDIPTEICQLFDRLLSKEIAERPPSATAFLNQLEQIPKRSRFGSILFRLLLTLVAIVVCVLVYASLLTTEPVASTSSVSHMSASEAIEYPFEFSNMEGRFRSLAEAIAAAEDGQEILVEGDGPLETPQIEVGRKRIAITAKSGSTPLFIPRRVPQHFNKQFLRSESDLHLKGIHVDWLVEIDVTDLQLMREMPAVYCNNGNLLLENCVIRRGKSGTCAHGSRSVEIRGCLFEGGTHCLSWYNQGGSVRVEDSTLKGPNGFLVVFPPAGLQSSGKGLFKIINTSIIAKAAIEIPLARAQTNPIQFDCDSCKIETAILVSLVRAPSIAAKIEKSQPMVALMRGAMLWNESNSQHLAGQVYLSSRMLRQPERRYSSDLIGLASWRGQWQSTFPGSFESPMAQERK